MVRFWPNLSRRQVYSLLPLLHTGNTVLFYFVFAFSSSPSTLKTKYSWEMDFGNPPPQKQINNLTLNGLICVRANLQKTVECTMCHICTRRALLSAGITFSVCLCDVCFCWHLLADGVVLVRHSCLKMCNGSYLQQHFVQQISSHITANSTTVIVHERYCLERHKRPFIKASASNKPWLK